MNKTKISNWQRAWIIIFFMYVCISSLFYLFCIYLCIHLLIFVFIFTFMFSFVIIFIYIFICLCIYLYSSHFPSSIYHIVLLRYETTKNTFPCTYHSTI